MTSLRKLSWQALTMGAIVLSTLLLVEVVCQTFDIFPPQYNYGDPELGWAPIVPGKPTQASCLDQASGTQYSYDLNETGIRTAKTDAEILTEQNKIKIAVVGDSQTDLCAPTADTHPGVLESTLQDNDQPAVVLPYGQWRYSPLQSYLLFKARLAKYQPDIVVLNFYTGNDFLDMLRDDDRPSIVEKAAGFDIQPPKKWYVFDDPEYHSDSRMLFLFKAMLSGAGISGFVQRVRLLFSLAQSENKGFLYVVQYMNALRKTRSPDIGYPAAFAAQILNQQLFFYFFPESRERSVARTKYLMCLAKEENPNALLVLSAIPSYQLTGQKPVDPAFKKVVEQIPIDYGYGVGQEQELYEKLHEMAEECGWFFIDNMPILKNYRGPERLYNDFDYHLTIAASRLIGANQASSMASIWSDLSRGGLAKSEVGGRAPN